METVTMTTAKAAAHDFLNANKINNWCRDELKTISISNGWWKYDQIKVQLQEGPKSHSAYSEVALKGNYI